MAIPFHRRIETAAVLLWALFTPLSIGCFVVLCLLPPAWPFLLCYLAWMTLVDSNAPKRGGRRIGWLRRSVWWKLFRNYFPVSLIKECELDPAKGPFVFGYHPHGIISIGAWINFGSEATGFSKLFPGICLHLLTLVTNFKIPFMRDFLLGMGLCDVSRESCHYILGKGAGSALMIVVGGAAEALDARPGTFDLTLKKRKGFIKIAMQHGASLVPVFSFGENDLFTQVENPRGSRLRQWQSDLQHFLGFSAPLFGGRGVFSRNNFGFLPFRHPIVTVGYDCSSLGTPIPTPKTAKPTDAQIDEYHMKYTAGLTAIYEKYKNQYAPDRKSSLRIVE